MTAPNAPAPRAFIDYDFQTVLRAPPQQRLVLWLMVGLVAFAAAALAILKVDLVVSANGKIVTGDSKISPATRFGATRASAVASAPDQENPNTSARLTPSPSSVSRTSAAWRLSQASAFPPGRSLHP